MGIGRAVEAEHYLMLGTSLCGLRYGTGVLFRHCCFAFVEPLGKC